MLKEQAISLLTQVKEIILGSESWLDSTHQPIEEAFSMAIEAIKSMQHNTPNVLNALDTISRSAAMEDISKQQTYKMFEGEDTLYLDANDVGSVLASLPSVQPEPKWIPCSERLPEVGRYVIATTSWAFVTKAMYCGEHWEIDGLDYKKSSVVAWMPSPKPYRENKSIVIKKLKPCPFCGGTVKLQRHDHIEGDTTYTITCFNCYVDMGEYKTVEEIREVWNRRVES